MVIRRKFLAAFAGVLALPFATRSKSKSKAEPIVETTATIGSWKPRIVCDVTARSYRRLEIVFGEDEKRRFGACVFEDCGFPSKSIARSQFNRCTFIRCRFYANRDQVDMKDCMSAASIFSDHVQPAPTLCGEAIKFKALEITRIG
jgi:hypothetical protein